MVDADGTEEDAAVQEVVVSDDVPVQEGVRMEDDAMEEDAVPQVFWVLGPGCRVKGEGFRDLAFRWVSGLGAMYIYIFKYIYIYIYIYIYSGGGGSG